MSERNPILDKIKKLLRMKRGGTQGEIDNAMALAAALARKHGIDLASVNPDAEEQKIGHVTEVLKSRLPTEARFAAAILVNFFNVQIVLERGLNARRPWDYEYRVILVGEAWDTEVAKYVFAFLQGHFRRAWSHRTNRRLKNRYAFLNGMFLGLASKLEAERNQHISEAGIVLIGRAVQLRKEYVAQHWPNSEDSPLAKDDSDAAAARWAGVQAGQETNIRRAVNGTPAPARPALPPAAGQLSLL